MRAARLYEFLSAVAHFDVAEYARRVAEVGRRALSADAALVDQVRSLAAAGARLRRGEIVDRRQRQVVDVAALFFAAQDSILRREKPRYEPYTSLPLLRHVLAMGFHPTVGATRQIWLVVRELLHGQLDFELAALSDPDWPRVQFDPEVCRARIAALNQVWPLLPRELGSLPGLESAPWRLDEIARGSSGRPIVRRLLVFPQTTCHDEVAFLRFILMTECLFWGALLFVKQALAAFHRGQRSEALRHVGTATQFAAPLIKIFQAVRTMPPHHFLGFREATGEASAVQSLNWQLLDAHVYGVLPEKIPILARTPEVKSVLDLARPGFVPLVQVVGELGPTGVDAELREAIIALDHRLLAWRTFHERQLAGRQNPSYLPPQALGTGGTPGHPYLAAQKPPRASRIPTGGRSPAVREPTSR